MHACVGQIGTPGHGKPTTATIAKAPTPASKTAAAADNVLVLVSIRSSDIEVGRDRGREALERLKNVVQRKAAQWQPAWPHESFEIVRRRMFDPIPPDKARVRDGVIRAFSEMHRMHSADFRSEVSEADYRCRMELSYRIRPELFDRLFGARQVPTNPRGSVPHGAGHIPAVATG